MPGLFPQLQLVAVGKDVHTVKEHGRGLHRYHKDIMKGNLLAM